MKQNTVRILLLVGSELQFEQSTALEAKSSLLSNYFESSKGAIEVSALSHQASVDFPWISEHLQLDESAFSRMDRILLAIGCFRLRSRFDTFAIGRLINSLGLIDKGRVFWRAVKCSPVALSILKSADVIIATDLVSTKTAWHAVRLGWVGNAFYDRRSAPAAVNSLFSSTENTS